jgi:hypothetical protein
LRIRYDDFAYLYWLRFGYFIGADSGSGLHHHDALKPGAVHQRLGMIDGGHPTTADFPLDGIAVGQGGLEAVQLVSQNQATPMIR